MDFTKLTDRELDAEVAKRMGWTALTRAASLKNKLMNFGTPPGASGLRLMPEYSSTREGAGQVLERAVQDGWEPGLEYDSTNKMWNAYMTGQRYLPDAFNAYAPRAICEAFCMAVPLEVAT